MLINSKDITIQGEDVAQKLLILVILVCDIIHHHSVRQAVFNKYEDIHVK
jgi:hypothetical protein